jgi:hypothetical protein
MTDQPILKQRDLMGGLLLGRPQTLMLNEQPLFELESRGGSPLMPKVSRQG